MIWNADCLEMMDNIEDGVIDLTVFSPPYDAIRTYENNPDFDLHKLGAELLRVTKDGGVCAMVIQDGTKDFAKSLATARTQVAWVDMGWKLFECCIYSRDGRPGAWWNKRFRVDHEYILIFFKGVRPRFFDKEHLKIPAQSAWMEWGGTTRTTKGDLIQIAPGKIQKATKCRGTVWRYATSSQADGKNKVKMLHPATYPDKLAEDLILCFSGEGDVVLDPMCGSGTTCVMAPKNGRKFIGIEVNPNYCKIAEERLAKETENVAA